MIASILRERVVGRVKKKPLEEQRRIKDRIVAFQIGPFGWLVDMACSLMFSSSLKSLATIYMTDKWNFHYYAQHYEDLLRRSRRTRLNVLEIGVGGYDDPRRGGGSLRMWNTYFPKGQIYGIDIYDKSPHNRRRIKTFRGSQTDPSFLDAVVREIGPIDIIVDDGSHKNDHILSTFQHLFPHLADNGIYAIEDTQTSYWPEFGGNMVDRNELSTSMGYFKSLLDGLNWEEFRGTYSPTYLDRNVKSVAFYHNLVVVRKGLNCEGSPSAE